MGFDGGHIAGSSSQEERKVIVHVYDIFNSATTVSAEKFENADILLNGHFVNIVHGDTRDQEEIIQIIKEFGVTGAIHVGGMVS